MKGPVIFFSLRSFFSQSIHLNHFLQLKQWIKLAGQCKSVWLGCRKENLFGPQCKVLYDLFNTPQSALLCFDKPQSALWSLWLKTNDHEALWVSNIMPQSALLSCVLQTLHCNNDKWIRQWLPQEFAINIFYIKQHMPSIEIESAVLWSCRSY